MTQPSEGVGGEAPRRGGGHGRDRRMLVSRGQAGPPQGRRGGGRRSGVPTTGRRWRPRLPPPPWPERERPPWPERERDLVTVAALGS